MAKFASVTLTGDREIDRKLRSFEPKLQKKGIRKALRTSAKIIQTRAISRAPVDTGELEQSIKVRALRGLRRGTLGVGIDAGSKKRSPWLPFYAYFLEHGTAERRHKTTGKSVGRIEAGEHDFLLPSMYESEGAVKVVFITTLRSWLATFGRGSI